MTKRTSSTGEAIQKQEELDRQQEFNAKQDKFYELAQDRLKAEDSLAETADRAPQGRARNPRPRLQGAHRAARAHPQGKKDAAERDSRRARFAAMPGQYQLDRANVNKATQTPLEEYMAQLPLTADKMTEALQRVEVHGLQMLEDGILGVITGTMKLKDAFHKWPPRSSRISSESRLKNTSSAPSPARSGLAPARRRSPARAPAAAR
jgi:hypothetical protein